MQPFRCNIYGIEDTFIYIYTHCPATLGLPFHFSFPSHQKSESFRSRQSLRQLLFTAGEGKGKLGKEKKEKMEKPKGQRLFRQKELLPPACGSTHTQLLQSAVGFCFHGGELSHPLFIQSWEPGRL